jgi:serine protease Do
MNHPLSRLLRFALLFFSMGALFAACTGMPPAERFTTSDAEEQEMPAGPERSAFVRKELEDLLSDGKPEVVLQRVERIRRDDGPLEEPVLSELGAEARRLLLRQFEEAVADRDFHRGITLYYSLRAEGLEGEAEDWSLSRLYAARGAAYLEEGNEVLGLHTALRAPDLESLPPEELLRWVGVAQSLRNRYALGILGDALKAQDQELPQEAREIIARAPEPGEMLKGTVTVWVNRGIRLERGMGVPDRVVGSGFFIDSRGYLLTNYHVIESEVSPEYEGYSRLFIRLPGQADSRIPARVVGYDRIFDIALLKAEIDPAYVFPVTAIRDVQAGDRIYAMGSPGGLENSISSGIISATQRRFLQLGDAIQVDVPINPGNSGGPLVSTDGELIGVVFAGIEQFEGVNFAIPSAWLQLFLPDLYEEGEVVHPWLGAAVREAREGLEIVYVVPRSPAQDAGFLVGDRITGVDGWEPRRIGDAQRIILSRNPESLLRIAVTREGESFETVVALEERPYSPIEDIVAIERPEDLFPPLFGMRVQDISGFPWQRNFVITRVYPGTIADETGLSEQDPFSVQNWRVDLERDIALLQIVIKKRKAGFLESGIQLASFLEIDNFL